MSERQSGSGLPDVDQEAISERASAAFSALGNETRLQILFALWEAYEFEAETNALTFSELREWVAMRDSGQFSYHLEKLVGEFVRKNDAGYTLTMAGQKVVRAVVETVGLEEPTPDPVAVPEPCPLCGGTMELRYESEWLFLRCTECPGRISETDEIPRGTIVFGECSRAAFTGRTLREVFDALWGAFETKVKVELRGICPECFGPVTRSVSVCRDHDSDGICETCRNQDAVTLEMRCAVCKDTTHRSVASSLRIAPEVQGLAVEHGVPFRYGNDVSPLLPPDVIPDATFDIEVRSVDPPSLRVTLTHDEGELAFTVDGEFTITDVAAE